METCSQAHAARSVNFSRQIIDSARKTSDPFLLIIAGKVVNSSAMIPVTEYTVEKRSVFCVHGIVSWSRRSVIAAVGCSRGRARALHEVDVDGPRFLDLFSNQQLLFGTCSIADNLESLKSCIEWKSIRLWVQAMGSSPRESSRSSTLILGYATERCHR